MWRLMKGYRHALQQHPLGIFRVYFNSSITVRFNWLRLLMRKGIFFPDVLIFHRT